MKCPKCGYSSFDYLDECKNCNTDISDVRAQLGVIAVAPDDRAASSPQLPAGDEEVVDTMEAPAGDTGQSPLSSNDYLGEDLTGKEFDESFNAIVEPTGYSDAGEDVKGDVEPEITEPASSEGEGESDEEFLDLDFGGIFEEDEEK